MAIASPRSGINGTMAVPIDYSDERGHRQLLARAIHLLQAGALVNPTIVPTTISATFCLAGTEKLILADASTASLTVFLAPAVGRGSQEVIVKKTDSSVNTVTITGSSGSIILAQQNALRGYMSNGTNWHLVREIGTANVLGDVL